MEYKLITKSVLHQLGIGKNYSGYDYILRSIELIMHNEDVLTNVTKILYIDVAKEYHTSQTCVERNIRKVIEVIWKHSDENSLQIERIFGKKHLCRKPSNKEFLELLYEYIKLQDAIKNTLISKTLICPISNKTCSAFDEILKNFI
jgi:two-component system response regulator (stage 0 sporulation protein A)